MTESIQNFLNERKELWLKDRLKKAENDSAPCLWPDSNDLSLLYRKYRFTQCGWCHSCASVLFSTLLKIKNSPYGEFFYRI